MNLLLSLVSIMIICACAEFQSNEPSTFEERLIKAKLLLKEVPLVDGHNDLAMNIRDGAQNQLAKFPFERNISKEMPWSSIKTSTTDLPKLRIGGLGAQFWAAYIPCDSQYKNAVVQGFEQIDVIKRLVKKYPKDLQMALTAQDIMDAFGRGRIASLIGVEGGHMIDSSSAILRIFYEIGVRYLTLTHFCDTPWAEMSGSEQNPTSNFTGLTQWGKSLIGEMNRLGMLVDISHVSHSTMLDVLNVTKAPVIFSHSSARAICNSTRNVPDDILNMMSSNGGIVMVNFLTYFVSCSANATLHQVIDHINHIKKVAGIDHVGIGSDFDGISSAPEGLENVTTYPNLIAELMLYPQWTSLNLKKLMGLNLIRVMQEMETVKESLINEVPFDTPIPFEDIEDRLECKNIWHQM